MPLDSSSNLQVKLLQGHKALNEMKRWGGIMGKNGNARTI